MRLLLLFLPLVAQIFCFDDIPSCSSTDCSIQFPSPKCPSPTECIKCCNHQICISALSRSMKLEHFCADQSRQCKSPLICQLIKSQSSTTQHRRSKRGARASVEERICIFNGVVHTDRSEFSISCRHRCRCSDGFIVCQDLCLAIETSPAPPLAICPYGAELVMPRSNQCCREWACKQNYLDTPFNQHLRSKKQALMIGQCTNHWQMFSSDWSNCSKSCGIGQSTRMSNENQMCINVTETRFCHIKMCQHSLLTTPSIKQISKCEKMIRSPAPINIQVTLDPSSAVAPISLQLQSRAEKQSYVICRTRRKYRPRYCTHCSTPIKSKTKRMEFICSDSVRRILMYQWIQLCR